MDILSLQTLLLIIFFLIFYYFIFFNLIKSPHKATRAQIGFSSYPLVGTVPEFILNRHRFLEWTTEVISRSPTKSGIFDRPGKIKGFITANPANVEHILKTNFDNYPKGARLISLLDDFLGRGIFNAEGESWRAQRKIASYEFNTRSLKNFVMETAAVELHNRFIPVLAKNADLNRVVDLQDLLESYTFDNICMVAFNVDPGCLAGNLTSGREFMEAFEEAAAIIFQRFLSLYPSSYKIKKLLRFSSELKLQKSITTVHKFAEDIIKSRMEEKNRKPDEDLLSRFMEESEYSPEYLRDIVISFILAGRDTTSSALTWFFWLLSSHPEVEEKILDELKTIRSSSGGVAPDCFTFDELRNMHYLQAAISEGLRLYPPVPLDTKDCLKDDVMPDGTFVGKGWYITYHSYAMARIESVWGKDCLEFRPERWLVEEDGNVVYRPENSFKFPVFHGGPRICLGKEMAYIQMKLVAASIIERFKVEVVPVANEKNPPEHVLALTIRMKNGLSVRIRKRSELINE
ncbi:cytochrome P450 CYP94D108-like [Rutidosis leptorrhynchoides]|uniref:cytochrome P450 CYP94D108-like n=1 Tax=Rutidosis leptorrhynchoides TaxID=125765 RepID=UPI003A993ED3